MFVSFLNDHILNLSKKSATLKHLELNLALAWPNLWMFRMIGKQIALIFGQYKQKNGQVEIGIIQAGKWMIKREPSPGRLLISIFPPCSVMTLWVIARPRPVPFSLVVKNGLKMFSMFSGEIPGPVS
jgi:hypothetical protein